MICYATINNILSKDIKMIKKIQIEIFRAKIYVNGMKTSPNDVIVPWR